MNGLYDKARKEKIRELRRLMQELIADGDEAPMEEADLAGAMDEAGDSAEDLVAAEEMEEASEGDAMAEEEGDELASMRREFFQAKKPKPGREGSAMMVAKFNPRPQMSRRGRA